MKIPHDKASLLVRDFYYPDVATRRCIHVSTFLCWFAMVFIGTTIIGVGTANSSLTYPFCDDSASFCTQNILVDSHTELYFYVKLASYHQNNRMYLPTHPGSSTPIAMRSCTDWSTIPSTAETITPTQH
jgi:hypothetical protein